MNNPRLAGNWSIFDLGHGWADENTNPTRKRGLETFPRLRIGLVETPLINWNTRFSSGHPDGLVPSVTQLSS